MQLIDKRDVIRMKVPYPGIGSDLAVTSHMYICKKADGILYEYVKCQTLKPAMLSNSLFRHFVDEYADIARNPFQKTTRIDCDKMFCTDSARYDDRLKTTARPDICQELYDLVVNELEADGYDKIDLDADILASINPLISKI